MPFRVGDDAYVRDRQPPRTIPLVAMKAGIRSERV